MAYNFVVAEREQQFLLPPDMRDWLPEDHLAWFVIEVVDQLDLRAFRSVYRSDGHGRPAYDPAMIVAVLLYAYSLGVRSSREIEQRCRLDIAFRVLTGGHTPDHTTFARFRQRHQDALAALLAESLRLCAAAGLVRLGTVLLDGTKIEANASKEANRTLAQIDDEVARMLAEADAADTAEDDREDREGGSSLPAELVDARSRRARLAQAKATLERNAQERAARFQSRQDEADARAEAAGRPSRPLRPRPRDEEPRPDARANVTDPQSRLLRAPGRSVQGYNAQAASTADGVIVGAECTDKVNDVEQLEPMLNAIKKTTKAAGIRRPRVRRLVADAGYWRAENVDGSLKGAPELFITPSKTGRTGRDRKDGRPSESKTEPLRQAMFTKLSTPRGRRLMKSRASTIEPIFGDLKHNRRARHFSRRGLAACDSEWKLLCATHNLLKLRRHQLAGAR